MSMYSERVFLNIYIIYVILYLYINVYIYIYIYIYIMLYGSIHIVQASPRNTFIYKFLQQRQWNRIPIWALQCDGEWQTSLQRLYIIPTLMGVMYDKGDEYIHVELLRSMYLSMLKNYQTFYLQLHSFIQYNPPYIYRYIYIYCEGGLYD